MAINLGDEVMDVVTGLKGIAVSKIEYINGCTQWGVKARVKDAAIKEAEYIDAKQVIWISDGINSLKEGEIPEFDDDPPGGDMPDRPRGKKR